MRNTTILLAVMAAALLLAGSGVQAGNIAYEGFAYGGEYVISGLNGGSGWTDAWSAAGDLWTRDSGGRSYSTLPVVPTEVRFYDGGGAGSSTRHFTSVSTGSAWVSMILANLDTGTPCAVSLSTGVDIGGSNGKWSLIDGGTTSESTTATTEERFIVVRVDFGATDDYYMWLNPSLDSEPTTGSADASLSGCTHQAFGGITLVGANDTYAAYDEIRVGDTWGGVIPEPATMSLLVLGGLGVLIRRRRKA